MKPSLRQIECFQAVAELGSFSRAAERMNTTQPALSQAIRDLETGLGARLFDRTTRRVDLTEAGEAFAASAFVVLTELDRAVSNVQDLGQLRRGRLRIAAPPLLAAAVLPAVIRETAAHHPDLSLRVEDLGTDAIVGQVRNGRADLGLGTFQPGEEGVVVTPVLRDRLMVFLATDHALASQPDLTWTQIAGQPQVALTRESGLRLLTEVGYESAGQPFRPALEVHQIHTALALVEQARLIAVLPAYAKAAVHGRPIVARALTAPDIAREVALLRARDRSPSPAHVAVAAILTRVLRRMAA